MAYICSKSGPPKVYWLLCVLQHMQCKSVVWAGILHAYSCSNLPPPSPLSLPPPLPPPPDPFSHEWSHYFHVHFVDIKREEWDDLLFYVVRENKVWMCSKKASTSQIPRSIQCHFSKWSYLWTRSSTSLGCIVYCTAHPDWDMHNFRTQHLINWPEG